ncbi:alpha/beta fold hydrolase [Pelomonas sp. SE-A7]|uniref:alpha/beta hydrolase n=1 Tax=Pelomonas sp. SE-A7 TaxID=3054953 RepID=UPI00259C6D7C|nr:alpha/beta fold hydrolase [Pelomonas sp. SE-A7]MDM4766877.1 alpha/beta fold hydrolase [Pelomonas sp. SE-A7]
MPLLSAPATRAAEPESLESPASLERPGAMLQGTLLRPPAGQEASPLVVLLISGSGPTDRDGNSPALPGKNNSLRLLAESLARAGFASLRYDKRGIAASATGPLDESQLRFEHFAEDAAAWADWLRREQGFRQVAVIGHSEGAALGLLAAQQTRIDAYVSLAGAGRDAATVLRAQLQTRLTPPLAEQNERILQALTAGETVAEVPGPLAPLYRASVQPYLISWFKVDPAREIAKLRLPVAIVQGETDIQVSVDQDARRLAQALPAAELKIIPGMNHVLKTATASDLKAYADPSLPLSESLVDYLVGFLRRAVR